MAAQENRDPHRRFAVASRSLTRPRPSDAPLLSFKTDRSESMQMISTSAAADNAAFFAAIVNAERRALHSYFDQHVVADEEAGYITIDEGDYGALPMTIIDRIVHSVPGGRLDEF
ncbi:hypothetical protein C100_16005 [Sphingobium sp. C100]|nr:hypothetical protein C100_16005 [Sphingobium sp. C100]